MKRIIAFTIALIIALTGTFSGQDVAHAASVPAVKNMKATLYNSRDVKITWSKDSSVSGYQVQRYEGSYYNTWKTITSNSTTSYMAKDLKKGKTHKFAVRAYKWIDGKKVFSERKVYYVYVPKVMTINSTGFSNTTAGKLIKTAKNKLGSRYVSGASGPNKFDCSGYVYYICKTADVSTKYVSRTSSSQMWSNLKKYSIGTTDLSKAQPGDIVFTASTGGSKISHVGFYYSKGNLIHATNPRQGVVISQAKYFGKVKGIVRLPNL